MPSPLPSQNVGVPMRPVARPVMAQRPAMGIPVGLPVQAAPQAQPTLRRPMPPPQARVPVRPTALPAAAAPAMVRRPMMAKGGVVKKLKKPMKRKTIGKKKVAKYAEGGAVERFLQKYPDYKP